MLTTADRHRAFLNPSLTARPVPLMYADRAVAKQLSVTSSAAWLFHIATIETATGDVARFVDGYAEHIENAIARTLYRAGYPLPAHERPFKVAQLLGPVLIENVLPKALRATLDVAFSAQELRRRQSVGVPSMHVMEAARWCRQRPRSGRSVEAENGQRIHVFQVAASSRQSGMYRGRDGCQSG